MSSSKNVTLAFLVGGAIGAALALLFAPSSGEETRRRLKDGLDDAEGWAKDRYQDARFRVADGSDKVKAFVGEKKEDLHAAYDAGKEAYHRNRERLIKES